MYIETFATTSRCTAKLYSGSFYSYIIFYSDTSFTFSHCKLYKQKHTMLYLPYFYKLKKRIIIFALLLVLSAFIIYLLLPPTTKAINQSALVVEQQAYYQLEIMVNLHSFSPTTLPRN